MRQQQLKKDFFLQRIHKAPTHLLDEFCGNAQFYAKSQNCCKNDRKLWNDRKSWLWCHKIATLISQNCVDILKRLREYSWSHDFAQFSDFL